MTIYYETAMLGLVPVDFVSWAKTPTYETTGCYNVVIRVKRTGKGYKCGQVLHVPPWAVVEKAGVRNYHQMVRKAALPAITAENTSASRWPHN